MSELTVKMQQDLKKKLDCLCFIHDQPKLHLVNEFYELRNSIDIDALELLAQLRLAQHDDEAGDVVKANETGVEFIRILRELEEKCLSQFSQTSTASSTEIYGDYRTKIDQLKSCEGEQLENAYLKLALELTDETCLLEKRLFGEQTIFYVSSRDHNQLGSLVYIGQDRLTSHQVAFLRDMPRYPEEQIDAKMSECYMSWLCCERTYHPMADKNYMIFRRLVDYFESTSSPSEFIYMGKDDKRQYKGYFPKNACIETEFVSYRFPIEKDKFEFNSIAVRPSFDLLDLFLADEFQLSLFMCQLLVKHIFSHPSAARLVCLDLQFCDIQRFDDDLLEKCVNLKQLSVDSLTLSFLRFDSEKPSPVTQSLTKLAVLAENNPHFELPSLANLVKLEELTLIGDIEDNPLTPTRLTEDKLKALAVIPRLTQLTLMTCEINTIGAYAFANFKSIQRVCILDSKIGHIHEKAFVRGNGKMILHILRQELRDN